MHDLEPDAYTAATEALSDQRAAYRRYLEIVDAQRAALGSDNLRVVTALAARLDGIIAEIQVAVKRLAPALEAIERRSVDGPRTQALRDLMTATAAEAALAQLSIRDLTKQIAAGRDQVAKELDGLALSAPGSRAVGGPQNLRSALINTPALIDTSV